MTLQCTLKLPYTFSSLMMKDNHTIRNSLASGTHLFGRRSRVLGGIRAQVDRVKRARGNRVTLKAAIMDSDTNSEEEEEEEEDKQNNPFLMDEEERREWRKAINEALRKIPEEPEDMDPAERAKKVEQLMAKYPLIVEEDDPDWPEDSDGWGFNFSQFFDKITIKNSPKKDNEDDDDDDDSDDEIVFQDDNYIRPIKDIKTAEWEEAVFKDISPLIVLVHHRYRRPKENEKFRDELEKAVHIIWNCRLPSPRCVAVDAIVETDLVSALQVSVFPELIFTKAGKILYREKANRNADELSKIMAFFYYGGAKPPCLKITGESQESIPTVSISSHR